MCTDVSNFRFAEFIPRFEDGEIRGGKFPSHSLFTRHGVWPKEHASLYICRVFLCFVCAPSSEFVAFAKSIHHIVLQKLFSPFFSTHSHAQVTSLDAVSTETNRTRAHQLGNLLDILNSSLIFHASCTIINPKSTKFAYPNQKIYLKNKNIFRPDILIQFFPNLINFWFRGKFESPNLSSPI